MALNCLHTDGIDDITAIDHALQGEQTADQVEVWLEVFETPHMGKGKINWA